MRDRADDRRASPEPGEPERGPAAVRDAPLRHPGRGDARRTIRGVVRISGHPAQRASDRRHTLVSRRPAAHALVAHLSFAYCSRVAHSSARLLSIRCPSRRPLIHSLPVRQLLACRSLDDHLLPTHLLACFLFVARSSVCCPLVHLLPSRPFFAHSLPANCHDFLTSAMHFSVGQ